MRRAPLIGGLVAASLVAAAAWADSAAPDLSGLAGLIQAETVRATAAEGAMPSPCTSAPPSDTLLGTVGSAPPCLLRSDAARPTAVQAVNVTTDASGNWTVTWAKPFMSANPAVNPLPVNTGTMPILCNVQTRSTTGATGRCWQSNTNTLPSTLVALGGLVINPFTGGAANTSVMVIAREATQ